MTEGYGNGWVDPDQPVGFESTATFAPFVDEPQSTTLLEQAKSRRVLEGAH